LRELTANFKEQGGNYAVCELSNSEEVFTNILRGGDTGVLLVHGFTGSPHDFEYMANELNKAGLTVSVPRLPGAWNMWEGLFNYNASRLVEKSIRCLL